MSEIRGAGFQARISGASLSDLVQMECLAGSQSVVRVTSAGATGHLYFRGGAVVHAVSRSLSGETAALDMLSWNDGTFEPVERDWPNKENISCGWQSLLIRAAQIRDERRAQSVVALRSEARTAKPGGAEDQKDGLSKMPAVENIELDATPIEVAGHVLRMEDFALVLRLKRDGAIALNHRSTQDFADIVAYACQLAELIGQQLGIERFVALECTFKSGRCFIVVESGGEVVALRPHESTDVGSLRDLFGI